MLSVFTMLSILCPSKYIESAFFVSSFSNLFKVSFTISSYKRILKSSDALNILSKPNSSSSCNTLFSKFFCFCFTQDKSVVVLDEGIHSLDGMKVEVVSTPGHAEDCLSYIIEDWIFTGDSYIPFAKVFTKWPTSNKALALENEARLKEVAETRKLKVYPGHWIR